MVSLLFLKDLAFNGSFVRSVVNVNQKKYGKNINIIAQVILPILAIIIGFIKG